MRVLVAGGAGYIGSHACKALARAGHEPIVYDNLVYGHRWAVRWGPFEHGDILDRNRLDQVFRQYEPEAIMHFAAYTYVGESVAQPGKYYNNNVSGSLALLQAARDHDVDSIVFSSTCAVYGLPDAVPISEHHPKRPINPYGTTKLMIETMLGDFESAHGMKYAALRYFNAAGADPEGEVGEAHDPETHLIPLVIDAAAGRRPHVSIFGTDYPTPDGTAIRDYVHVSDLAVAHVAALEYLSKERRSLSVNLGTGNGYSVREVISAVEQVSGHRVPVKEVDRRAGDPPVLVAAPGHGRSLLGWAPSRSDLHSIIQTAWKWHNEKKPQC